MSPSKPQAVLLVDGYNIIGNWPHLREKRDRAGLEAARRELSETLVNYSTFQGYETRLVFDAQYQNNRAVEEIVTPHLSIHYTDHGQTADTFIEKVCADVRHEFRVQKKRLIVATSDRAQQLTVMGYGAELLSAEQFSREVDLMLQLCQRRYKSRKNSPKRFLANTLDAESQQRLAMLRKALS
jgi:uncharacterized protein